jgi:hypothetical protein
MKLRRSRRPAFLLGISAASLQGFGGTDRARTSRRPANVPPGPPFGGANAGLWAAGPDGRLLLPLAAQCEARMVPYVPTT